jgi:4-hydroxy-tetrahydrodipicolinate synthase
MFRGVITALVTPFRAGRLDEEAYRRLIDWQIQQGVHGIVPCGTTGESATLSHEEHGRVIDIAVDEARGRVPVIAGTGSNSTAEAIQLTRHAKEAGADGALLITPYYNKPTQEGLYRHYKAVADEAKFPIILYNVPGRTGVNLLPDTVARLSETPEVVGIKEATGDLKQVSDVLEKCGNRLSVLSGDDFTVLPLLALGGAGVISVLSNVVPGLMRRLLDARTREPPPACRDLIAWLFSQPNPIPVNTMLAMMGLVRPSFRLPYVPMSRAEREQGVAILRQIGLAELGVATVEPLGDADFNVN